MLETAVGVVVLVNDKVDDVSDVEDIQTILDFLQVKPFDEVQVVPQRSYLKEIPGWDLPDELFDELNRSGLTFCFLIRLLRET